MKKYFKTAALAVSLLFVLSGCTSNTASTKSSPSVSSVETNDQGSTITVSAKAEIDVVPDVAYLRIGYTNTGSNTANTLSANNNVIDKVKTALKAKGYTDDTVTTDSFYIYPTYNYDSGTSKIKGYSVSHVLKVTVKDMSKIGDTIDTAIGAGANESISISYDVIDYDSNYNEAIAIAIGNGNLKADAIAKSIGASNFKLNKIVESSSSSYYPVNESYKTGQAAIDSSTQIQTGKITITAQLTIEYILTK